MVQKIHRSGLQAALHVMEIRSLEAASAAIEKSLRIFQKPDHRHRLEHASVLEAADIEDIARLGLVVSTSPLFIHNEKGWLLKRFGPDRVRRVYPFRAFLDRGVKLAGASDGPICSTEVLHAIQCAVTREGFETQQGITVAEAIRMFTLDAAYAQFEETVKGSIRVGKRADLVILSGNPARVPAEKIRELRVEATICGGRNIFQI